MPSSARVVQLRRLAVASIVAVLATSACESTPTPTTPSGQLQIVATSSTLRAGETSTLRVAATGTSTSTVTWTSSDASVASVTAAGLVTAHRSGRATITASAAAATGQLALRVVPNFAATWSGPLLRAQPACAAGSTAPVCVPGTPADVLRSPVTLTLVQTGATVSGTLIDALEPTIVVPLVGAVDASDVLALEGRSALPAQPGAQRRLTVTNLRATYDPTVDTITGAYTMVAERAASTGALAADYSVLAQFRDFPRR